MEIVIISSRTLTFSLSEPCREVIYPFKDAINDDFSAKMPIHIL